MQKKLTIVLEKFYHDLAISELKLKNSCNGRQQLTYNDILYLDIIAGHSGKYTATKIADMLQVSRPSVTSKINELCKKGYIIRKQDQKDKRIYYLFINQNEYFDMIDNQNKKLGKKIAEKIVEKYSERDLMILCESISLIGDLMMETDYDFKKQ